LFSTKNIISLDLPLSLSLAGGGESSAQKQTVFSNHDLIKLNFVLSLFAEGISFAFALLPP
jgi:hypothetical protein